MLFITIIITGNYAPGSRVWLLGFLQLFLLLWLYSFV